MIFPTVQESCVAHPLFLDAVGIAAAVVLIKLVAGGGGGEALLLAVEVILAAVGGVAALHESVTGHGCSLLAAAVVLVFLGGGGVVLRDGDVGNGVVVLGEVFLVGNLLLLVREVFGGGGFTAVEAIAAVFSFLHEAGLLFLWAQCGLDLANNVVVIVVARHFAEEHAVSRMNVERG